MLGNKWSAWILAGLLSVVAFPVSAGEIMVAVAANFSAPMARLAELFRQETGQVVKTSAGSSGKLYAQIKAGAPFDLFLAADEALPKQLEQERLAVGGTRFVYAVGRLVLWSAQADLVDARGAVLYRGAYNRLAIADPRLAPYGMAARETLEKLTMWNAIQGKLVKGENITQAYQFVATENAELGFVSLSQIMHDGKVEQGSWWLVPSELHKPIRQAAVLLARAQGSPTARAFLDFLKTPKAVALIRSYGYETAGRP